MASSHNTTNSTAAEVMLLATDSMGPMLNGLDWFWVSLSASFLALRLYCKRANNDRLWWDDYLLIFSWVSRTRRQVDMSKPKSSPNIYTSIRLPYSSTV
jgi:hypothetical protein